jgi:hypothetical protein
MNSLNLKRRKSLNCLIQFMDMAKWFRYDFPLSFTVAFALQLSLELLASIMYFVIIALF